MNRQFTLTDDAIRSALTPAAQVHAPFDLAALIRTTVDADAAAAPSVAFGVLPRRVSASVRIFVLVAIVGLLLLVGLLLAVGSRRPVLPALVSDVAMYHGGPGRTGVVAGPWTASPGRRSPGRHPSAARSPATCPQ